MKNTDIYRSLYAGMGGFGQSALKANLKPASYEPVQAGMAVSKQDKNWSSALAALWDEPFSYVKQYAEALNSVTQGYFISYFTQNCLPGEWLPLNSQTVQRDTGLTDKQWRSVRNRLMQRGLLLNKRQAGISLYTLDDDRLEHLIKQHSDLSITSMTMPAVSINKLHLRSLTGIGISIKSVIMLGYLQSATPYQPMHKRGEFSDWIAVPETEVYANIFLTRREQDTAIAELVNYGVVEKEVSGYPAVRCCRYSLRALANMTEHFLESN